MMSFRALFTASRAVLLKPCSLYSQRLAIAFLAALFGCMHIMSAPLTAVIRDIDDLDAYIKKTPRRIGSRSQADDLLAEFCFFQNRLFVYDAADVARANTTFSQLNSSMRSRKHQHRRTPQNPEFSFCHRMLAKLNTLPCIYCVPRAPMPRPNNGELYGVCDTRRIKRPQATLLKTHAKNLQHTAFYFMDENCHLRQRSEQFYTQCERWKRRFDSLQRVHQGFRKKVYEENGQLQATARQTSEPAMLSFSSSDIPDAENWVNVCSLRNSGTDISTQTDALDENFLTVSEVTTNDSTLLPISVAGNDVPDLPSQAQALLSGFFKATCLSPVSNPESEAFVHRLIAAVEEAQTEIQSSVQEDNSQDVMDISLVRSSPESAQDVQAACITVADVQSDALAETQASLPVVESVAPELVYVKQLMDIVLRALEESRNP